MNMADRNDGLEKIEIFFDALVAERGEDYEIIDMFLYRRREMKKPIVVIVTKNKVNDTEQERMHKKDMIPELEKIFDDLNIDEVLLISTDTKES